MDDPGGRGDHGSDPRRRLQLWPSFVHVVLDLFVGTLTFSVVITLLALTLGLLPAFLLGLPVLLVTFAAARLFARMERARISALLGVVIAAPPAAHHGSWTSRLRAEARSGTQWRQVAYSLLLPLSGLAAALVVCVLGAGLALLALPAYLAALPADGLVRDHGLIGVAGWMLAGGLLLPAAAAGTLLVARLDVFLASTLLGPGREAELKTRVETLTRSRSATVEAADAERRRIERDLHDGAQQRLVALAMNLGRARARMTDDPEAAGRLIGEAHDDAKLALQELRDLARGLHPAVLTDRGLDAALSALAARCPVPVELEVDVPRRCAPPVEAVAYFVVGESLTNVAKHAGASRVRVHVTRVADVLALRVWDDGRGGADPARGSGLAGLRDRVASVDGTLRLDSPAGGPTVLEVGLPCGW